MQFKIIRTIDDVQPFVADKKEIRFVEQANGVTVGCYMFMDGHTFDTPEALECRGIAFDRDGRLVSRPLHKFFNLGEKDWLSADRLLARNDVARIQEKLDGSLISTAWVDGELLWRSRKSFTSDVVDLTERMLSESDFRIAEFAADVAYAGMTACFELTHPEARIVIDPGSPQLRLLHVRDNLTGEYVMLDPRHSIHELIAAYGVPLAPVHNVTLAEALASLETMQEQEGYVAQFDCGDMVKIKCPWYQRLHRSITFLRERNIAELALNEQLDDVKDALNEVGVDLSEVNDIEARLKNALTGILDEVDDIWSECKELDRKSYAIKNQKHPYFSLLMSRYLGREVDVKEWYSRHRLRDEFSLRTLANAAQAEAIEG